MSSLTNNATDMAKFKVLAAKIDDKFIVCPVNLDKVLYIQPSKDLEYSELVFDNGETLVIDQDYESIGEVATDW